MNKKIYALIIFLLIVVINNSFFLSFVYNILWNVSYSRWDYGSASSYFQKSYNWYKSYSLKYNIANSLYKTKNYTWAISLFNQLKGSCKSNCFEIDHNLWNSLYRVWESFSGENKLTQWSGSIRSYDKALAIKYDFQTKANRDFVAQKYDEYKQQLESKSQQEKKWEQNSSSSSSTSLDWNSENNQNSSSSFWENQFSSNSSQAGENWSSSSVNSQWLSENQKDKLDQYMKSLQQQEKENQSMFNKKQQQNDQENLSPFSMPPGFEDPFSQSSSEQLDW